MGAARKIDDESYLEDLDARLDRRQPELRRLLRDTREGQDIMAMLHEAREALLAPSSPRETERRLCNPGDALAITVERQDDLRAGAGEVRVRCNGIVLWSCPFARGVGDAEAEEGAKLFAETLATAIGGV